VNFAMITSSLFLCKSKPISTALSSPYSSSAFFLAGIHWSIIFTTSRSNVSVLSCLRCILSIRNSVSCSISPRSSVVVSYVTFIPIYYFYLKAYYLFEYLLRCIRRIQNTNEFHEYSLLVEKPPKMVISNNTLTIKKLCNMKLKHIRLEY